MHNEIIEREGTARKQLTAVYSNNNNNENHRNTVGRRLTPRPTEFSNVQLINAIELLRESNDLVTGEQYENAIGLVIRAIHLLNREPVIKNYRESLDSYLYRLLIQLEQFKAQAILSRVGIRIARGSNNTSEAYLHRLSLEVKNLKDNLRIRQARAPSASASHTSQSAAVSSSRPPQFAAVSSSRPPQSTSRVWCTEPGLCTSAPTGAPFPLSGTGVATFDLPPYIQGALAPASASVQPEIFSSRFASAAEAQAAASETAGRSTAATPGRALLSEEDRASATTILIKLLNEEPLTPEQLPMCERLVQSTGYSQAVASNTCSSNSSSSSSITSSAAAEPTNTIKSLQELLERSAAASPAVNLLAQIRHIQDLEKKVTTTAAKAEAAAAAAKAEAAAATAAAGTAAEATEAAAEATEAAAEAIAAQQHLANAIEEGFRAVENRASENAERKRARKAFIRFLIRRRALFLHNLEGITLGIADVDLLGDNRREGRRIKALLDASLKEAIIRSRNEAWADYQNALRSKDTENIEMARQEFIYCFDTREEAESEIIRRSGQTEANISKQLRNLDLERQQGGNLRYKKQSKKHTKTKKTKKSKKTKRRIRKKKN
jgi:hypothetical protein